MARDGLRLTVLKTGQCTILALSGMLDISTVNQFIRESVSVIHYCMDTMLLDFSEVEDCDSTGLGALVKIHHAGRSLGVDVRIVRPRPAVRRLLDGGGLAAVFPIDDQPAA